MITDILIPLVAIGLAELGDKTQLSILLLASKTKKHLQLLLGVMLAFFITDGIAVLVGSWITDIVPIGLLKAISGVVFIIFGMLILRKDGSMEENRLYSKNPFLAGFLLIFITEWGDKTQIAAALFATKYDGLMVLAGTMIALGILSIVAIYLGKLVSDKIGKRTISRIAGLVFVLMGLSFFLF